MECQVPFLHFRALNEVYILLHCARKNAFDTDLEDDDDDIACIPFISQEEDAC
ncbi:hypothetical protein ES703_111005 [subsurface metagenome]